MTELRKVAIVGSARIPFCRAYTGYADETNLSMLSTALGGLADKYGLKGERIGEVMAGAVIAHSRDFNLAREALLDAGLSPRTPGTNMQIACGTQPAGGADPRRQDRDRRDRERHRRRLGHGQRQPDRVRRQVPAPADRRSTAPRPGRRSSAAFKGFSFGELTPVAPSTQEPRTGLSMGQHCELMAREWGITREEQDALALSSHQNAAKRL